MAGVRDHTELDVWKLSNQLAGRVRMVIDRPGFSRHGKLRGQIEEAVESACPNLAEGFARYLPRDNARFVRIALASLTELVEHLDRAWARDLITAHEHAALTLLARRARGAATRYVIYLQSATAPHLNRGRGRTKRGRRANPEP